MTPNDLRFSIIEVPTWEDNIWKYLVACTIVFSSQTGAEEVPDNGKTLF